MIRYTLSTLFRKALDVNSVSNAFTIPSALSAQTGPDGLPGVFRAGAGPAGMVGGGECPWALVLMPFGEGAPGASFSFRVFAWREVFPNADPNRITWLPFPLVEVFCTLSANGGPPNQGGTFDHYINDREYTCDFLSLTYGSLGMTGILSSPPQAGTGLTAYLVAELFGARMFSFDFQLSDANVGMNCLWSTL